MSEIIIELDPHSPRSREEQLAEIRDSMERDSRNCHCSRATDCPLDLAHALRRQGTSWHQDLRRRSRFTASSKRSGSKPRWNKVPGVTDALLEPQVIIPQLRIELDRDKLLQYGLTHRCGQRVHPNRHEWKDRL